MAPSPNTPPIIGPAERARRTLVEGNMYAIFYKEKKIIVEYHRRIVQFALIKLITPIGQLQNNEVVLFPHCWIFELNEASALMN